VNVPDGSICDEFVADYQTTISREPLYASPARLTVKGVWGSITINDHMWGTVDEVTIVDLVGPRPHSVIPLRRATDMIDYLSGDHLEKGKQLFRGVSSSEYELLPVALRSTPTPPIRTIATTAREQIIQEAEAAIAFYDAVYFQGLPIPDWSAVAGTIDFFREQIYKSRSTDDLSTYWPHQALHEFLAIAQHHGIPTRLLDWTLDPMVAAYFAACECERSSEQIAVWLVDRSAQWSFDSTSAGRDPLEPITVPYDVNQNARAQHGVFTLYLEQAWTSDPPDRTPYDQFLSLHAAEDPEGGVRKLTLPGSEVPKLLRLLDRRRVNGSLMFPGYYGAVRAARERAYWDR
jgi:hypothetical protein